MRIFWLLFLGFSLALGQGVSLVPTSWETQGATWAEVVQGRGRWTFTADLYYETPPSGTYRILLEMVTTGPSGASLRSFLSPAPPERLGGSGALGTLAVPGRTLWGAGFRPLLIGIGPGVRGRLSLELELEAVATGLLPPGYYFLQVAAVILPE